MTKKAEARRIYAAEMARHTEEMTRFAEKAAARVGVTRNDKGELPAVPQELIIAEAIREIVAT